MDNFQIRTDLALEAQERFREDNVEISGVVIEEEYREDTDIRITKVLIETENGSRLMGKSKGAYITLEAPNMTENDEDYQREISKELAKQIRLLINTDEEEKSVLVVGLGNRDVTPDALGPDVVGNLLITRHIIKEYGKSAMERDHVHRISAIVPGVMAQTGMETLEILKGIISETAPDLMIVVDALAARSTKRLNRTIQISDAGIHPGSGVGNNRQALTRDTLKIPVIAIGVPTVVDAATIVSDALGKLDEPEKIQLTRELITPQLNGMFVTPKDIDEVMKRLSHTISEGINMALEIGQDPA